MKKTMLQIKILYKDMGKAEKKIADWLLKNPEEIIPLSISELAENCGCSEATIVRFAKRLGFGGYQELKISIAREEAKPEVSEGISPDDSCFDILSKVSNSIYCSLEMTKNAINRDALEKAAAAIMSARLITVYGLGNSAPVALDFQHKLMRAGCNASAFSDNHMQVISASHLTAGDVAIGISHSGSSKDIVEALKIAKENGATTISITNRGNSPIVKQSDIPLFTASDETKYSILGLNSRIAQLAIISSIYYCIVFRQNEQTHTAIERTERSLQNKKF